MKADCANCKTHGFCYDVIKQEAKKKTDLFADFVIFDEEDCKEVIRQVKEELEKNSRWDTAALQRFIEGEIQRLGTKDWSRICILTRNNKYNTEIAEAFADVIREIEMTAQMDREVPPERIPFFLVDEFKFFSRQEIKDVLAFLKVAVNPLDSTSLERTLKRFGRGIGEKAFGELNGDFAYSVYMDEQSEKITVPYAEHGRGLGLGIFAVDSVTNKLKGMRMCGLGSQWTKTFGEMIEAQKKMPFEENAFIAKVITRNKMSPCSTAGGRIS